MVEVLPELDPELAPEGEIVVRALPEVGKIAILAVALGMILAADAIVRGFFGTVNGSIGWIPYADKVISSPVHAIEQKIISFLGGLEHHIDSSLGHSVHQTAQLAEQLWRTLENTAVEIILLGALAAGFTANVILPKLERFVHGAIRRVEKEITHVEKIAIRVNKVVTHTVTHQIHTITKITTVALPKYVHHELLAIRAEAQHALRASVRIEKEVRGLNRRVSPKAIVAALTTVVGVAAIDAIKCTQFGNLFKNKGCNLWKYLEDLIGLGLAALALESVCEFLPWIEAAFGAIVGPVVHLLNEVPLGKCEKEPKGWATLSVSAGPLPPSQTLGPFPG